MVFACGGCLCLCLYVLMFKPMFVFVCVSVLKRVNTCARELEDLVCLRLSMSMHARAFIYLFIFPCGK